jgi:hypothetical protein
MKLLKGTVIKKYYESGDSPSVIFNNRIHEIQRHIHSRRKCFKVPNKKGFENPMHNLLTTVDPVKCAKFIRY